MIYNDISMFLGKTLIGVEGQAQDAEVTFVFEDGTRAKMYHEQDCCESVYLAEIIGDPDDLLYEPLVLAEDVSNEAQYDGGDTAYGTCTWTFYRLGTRNATVTFRWYGSSNGYYSERVDLTSLDPLTPEEAFRYSVRAARHLAAKEKPP